MKVIQETRCAH